MKIETGIAHVSASMSIDHHVVAVVRMHRAKLGMHHMFDFERVGVVTDVTWIARGVRWFGFTIPGQVKVFPYADLDAAKTWISEPS